MTDNIHSIPENTVRIRTFLSENNLRFIERSYGFNDDQKDVFVVPGETSKTVFTARPYVSPSVEINNYNYFMASDDLLDWIVQDSDFLVSLKEDFRNLVDPSSSVMVLPYNTLKTDSVNLERDISFSYDSSIPDFIRRRNLYKQKELVLHIRTFADSRNLKNAYNLLPPGDIEFTNIL